jgi:signal transduction histidine kinase
MKHLSLSQSYYKTRIIVTFCAVTILLVLILSFLSYRFVRKLYLDQLSDQVNIITKTISHQIDKKYLELLTLGKPTELTNKYFEDIFFNSLNSTPGQHVFIFDKNLNVIINSDTTAIGGKLDPFLLLNQKEITGLSIDQSTASLPFKGDDKNWYLWGFYRLDNNYWLALRESAAKLERVEEFASLFFYIGFAGVFITILAGWILARSLTKPIDRLVEFSKKIGQGNFAASAPQNTRGELKILADSMDKMKKDIELHNKEKEKMLAQIAHEIRNPLGGIELLANLTKEDLVKDDNPNLAASEYLDKIICEVNSLKSLITSYLNFSRPLPANPEWINPDDFFKELKDNFETRLSKKNIDFTYKNEAGKIWFDKTHLKQIFLNLTVNSLESMKKDGSIFIFIFEEGNKLEIVFSDDGCGIEEKNLPHIFEPFFTTKKNGTGLGLAICKKLCFENKAELSAENNKEKGSTFTITKNMPAGVNV